MLLWGMINYASTPQQLFENYKVAADSDKASIANELMLTLKSEDVTDTALCFNKNSDIHVMDFHVYYLMGAYFYSKQLYDSAYACSQTALEHNIDSISNKALRECLTKVWEVQKNYHAQESERHDNLLRAENDNQKKMLYYTIFIFILAVLLMAALLATLYHSLRNRTKANALMQSHQSTQLDFFTKVAHEFRTPLTLIIGLSDNIENGRAASQEEVKKAAQTIRRNGYHMQRLTNQLLDLARLRSDYDKPEWHHANIVAYTDMIVGSFDELAKRSGITLHYLPAQKETDVAFVPDYYIKILNNLISNSIKYTPKGGNVLVTTSVEKDTFTLTVTDTGIGIHEEKMPHIFDDFYTSNVHPTDVSTGVGLALVKQMIDRIGGTIDVKSTEGKGTSFIINIPLREEKDTYPYYAVEGDIRQPKNEDDIISSPTFDDDDSDYDKTKPRILIVEDNAEVIDYIGSLLHDKYSIIYAHDGKEGLKIASEQVPDLIVSDLMMPGCDGLQLCRQIRASQLLSHIPFIIVTAKTSESDRIVGLQAGADAYITKPFNPDVLCVRVEQLIAQRQQLRDSYSKAIQNNETEQSSITLSENDIDFIQRVSNAVRNEMASGNVDVETIASIMCLSSKQLRRKIFAITGETTVAFIMRVRLEEAHNMLINNPDISVAEVAMKCGFEDGGYFTKAFKQQYKMTPTQMRKSQKSM